MKVRCYNFKRVLYLLDFKTEEQITLFRKLLELNDCVVFQPPFSRITSGPTKRPDYYIKSNSWFENYIKGQNTFGVLKGKRVVTHAYKKYEPERPLTLP